MGVRRLLLLGVVPVALLAMAPGAMATPRFANPTDIGTGDCLSAANACDLTTAVESASALDDVTILTGIYNEGTNGLVVPIGVVAHGQAGQPKPDLNFGTPPGMFAAGVAVNAGSVLRRVKITSTDTTLTNRGLAWEGTIEQVEVTAASGVACDALGGTIRDSFCKSTFGGGTGFRAQADGVTSTVEARNLTVQATASASSTGIRAVSINMGSITLNAVNVIANGGTTDVGAEAFGAGASATATLDHSNYSAVAVGMAGGTESVTPASGVGSNPTNQTALPVFAGDGFHVLSGQTIDAGGSASLLGSADVDGEARVQGAAIDIGADEVTPPAPPFVPSSPATTPGPTGRRAAALKRCKKKKGAARKKCKKKAAKLPA
ncbi:MAG: hypothetical protein ACXWED_01500 [Solirubrobacterales bacterium]